MNCTCTVPRLALTTTLLFAALALAPGCCQTPEERAMDRAERDMARAQRMMDRQMKAHARMMRDMEKSMEAAEREMDRSE